MKEDPPAPTAINPQLSPEVEKIILRALQKEPIHRYHSISELRTELEKAVLQPPVSLPAAHREDRKSESERTKS